MNAYATGRISVLRLVRFDRAMTHWYAPLLAAVMFGTLMHVFPPLDSLMSWEPGPRLVEFDLLYVTALSFFVLILFMTGPRTKSAAFYMTMPLPVRRVWTSRMLAMLFVTELTVAVMTVALAVRVPGGGDPAAVDVFTLRLGLHTGCAMALLLMLTQLPGLETARFDSTVSYAAYCVFVSLAVVFAAVVTVGLTPAWSIFLGGAAALALWISMHLPPSLSTTPLEPRGAPGSASGSGTGEAEGETGAGRAVLPAAPVAAMPPARRYLTVARVLINKWNFWLDCLMLFFYAFMASEAFYDGSRDNPWWLFGYIWIFAALMHSVKMLVKIDFLPLSRRRLFAIIMAPMLLSIFLGLGVGQLSVRLRDYDYKLIQYYDHKLQIPLEFYEISTGGPPPVLTSIWGEIHEPESHPVFGNSSIHIYKPYDTGPGSSPRFIALQIDRAVEAVHGVERDPLNKYEDLDETFVKNTEGCCFKVMRSVGRGSDTRSRVYALGWIITTIFYSVIIALQLRYGGRKRYANLILPASVVLIMGVVVFVIIAGKAGLCEPSFLEALAPILVRRAADAIPLSTGALWASLVALSVAGYFAIERSIMSFETPLVREAKKHY